MGFLPPPPLNPLKFPSWSNWLPKFPQQNVVDECKKKGWLKQGSKIEIQKSRFYQGFYEVHLSRNFFTRYYWHIFIASTTIYWGNWGKAIIFSPSYIFLFLYFYILLMAGLLVFRSIDINKTPKNLGYIETPNDFAEFLNKFSRGKNRIIEYDILAITYEWHEKNSQEFIENIRKAKNKKELRLVLGIR